MRREDTMECIRSCSPPSAEGTDNNQCLTNSPNANTISNGYRKRTRLVSMARYLAGIGAVTLCLLSSEDPSYSTPASLNSQSSIHRPRAVTASRSAAFPAADDIMHLIDPSSMLPQNVLSMDMIPSGTAQKFLSYLTTSSAAARSTSFRRIATDGSSTSPASSDVTAPSTTDTATTTLNANPAAPTAPLLWVHVPKSGNAFLQTLLWTVCASWPRDWSIMDYTGKNMAKYFERYSISSHCPDGMVEGTRPDFHGGLGGGDATGGNNDEGAQMPAVDSQYDAHRGNLVAMFRRPDERVVSSFWSRIGTDRGFPDTADLDAYRQRAAGCITKTLTRGGAYPCMESDVPPTDEEVNVAIERLRNGFAFVGLTEEWNLSMCLWHAMIGGTPYVEEFQTYRPVVVGKRPSERSAEEETELQEQQQSEHYDKADEAVYRAAEEVFWSNFDKVGMTAERCEEMIATAASRADLPPDEEKDEEEDNVEEEDVIVMPVEEERKTEAVVKVIPASALPDPPQYPNGNVPKR